MAGGGPAGAAAAALLARTGRSVVVLERGAGPADKICGEFLSGEAARYIERLGLDVGSLGGHPISAVRLLRGGRRAEAALPFPALGLSRRALDAALLDHAAAQGAEVRRGQTVLGADGATVRLAGSGRLAAEALLLATGKHDLRGLRRPAAPARDHLIGFKTHLRLSARQRAALDGWIELILFADAYAGLQRIEDGRANLCLLTSRARLDRCGGAWDRLLDDLCRESAHLRERMAGAEALLAQPLSIAGVPYGFVHRPRPDDPDNVFRLGDQAAVIPSFCGDGMAIALHSAVLAAHSVVAGRDAAAYHARLRSDVAGQVRRAWWLQRLGRIGAGQAALMAGVALWPGGLRRLAAVTRVPPAAIARALA